jgi:hypothetical protein
MAKKAAQDDREFLYVRSALDDNRVALHEIDPLHPGGSVIVAGDLVAKVGRTAYVMSRLRENWLEEADDADKDEIKRADEMAQQKIDGTPRVEAPLVVGEGAMPTRGEISFQGDYDKISRQQDELSVQLAEVREQLRVAQEQNEANAQKAQAEADKAAAKG